MTETDATCRPLNMPENFIPYMERHRIYVLFKEMLSDLVLNLPKDHLKHMKIYLNRHLHSTKDGERIIMLISSELQFDVNKVIHDLIKDLGVFVITRRCIMDKYEKDDEHEPGCVSPELMSAVTKNLTQRDPVPLAGWLMFDHPCTVREAQCLQQDGVLPTVTLLLMPPPPAAEPVYNPLTPARTFFQQDFEGLKFVYKATLKEVHIKPDDDAEQIALKCFNGIKACGAGAQGPGQGHHVVGAPAVYRVLLIGPRGSGRRSQAQALAKHFGLVFLHFDDLFNEAKEKKDEIGEKIRTYGVSSIQIKAEIVRRRISSKDCLDYGWVLVGYPSSSIDFENLDSMKTPPNRIILLNVHHSVAKARLIERGVDWCTGKYVSRGTSARVVPHPNDEESKIDHELDLYFSEAVAELRASAGITAVEINANEPFEKVQVKIQAAVIAAPEFDIECCSQLKNVRAD